MNSKCGHRMPEQKLTVNLDDAFPSLVDMVSNHGHHTDAYVNIMQGKVLHHANQLPKLVWNQIKVLIVANKDGTSRRSIPPACRCSFVQSSMPNVTC